MFDLLKEKIIIELTELNSYGFLSNTEHCFKVIQKLAKNIVEQNVSYFSCLKILNEDPDLFIIDLNEIMPNYFKNNKSIYDISKALISYCLYNYAVKYLKDEKIIKEEAFNLPPYVL